MNKDTRFLWTIFRRDKTVLTQFTELDTVMLNLDDLVSEAVRLIKVLGIINIRLEDNIGWELILQLLEVEWDIRNENFEPPEVGILKF